MPRLEVSPAQRHPASHQGGRGRWKTRLKEPGGGWRMEVLYNHFDFMQNYLIFNQFGSRVECGEDFWMKVKVSFEFVKFSTCELWIGGHAHCPCTSFQPSWRGRDEPNESESFIICLNSCRLFLWISVLDTVWRTKVLVRWFNKSKYSSLFLQ